MTKEAKEALRTSLVEEQGEICAYCMRRIKNDSTTKIEHYTPRDSENELDYNNLLAVCSGNMGQPYNLQTCDTRKGNIPIYINPQQKSHIMKIKYRKDGTIESSDPKANRDINEILNLNCEYGYLKRNRKQAYDQLIFLLSSTHSNKAETRRTLLKLRNRYQTPGKKEEYVGILLYFVEKYLKKY